MSAEAKTKLKVRIDFDGRQHPFHPDADATAGELKAERSLSSASSATRTRSGYSGPQHDAGRRHAPGEPRPDTGRGARHAPAQRRRWRSVRLASGVIAESFARFRTCGGGRCECVV